MKSVGTDESGMNTAIGEWVEKAIAKTIKWLWISFLCGLGGSLGVVVFQILFLKLGGATWLLSIVQNAATM
jgi:hypothetical protein